METDKNNKATDTGCNDPIEKCMVQIPDYDDDGTEKDIDYWFYCLKDKPCPIHEPETTTPSPSEWEEIKCRRCSMKLNDCPKGRWQHPLCVMNGVEWDQHVVGLNDLETLLSQERERMVAIGERFKKTETFPQSLHKHDGTIEHFERLSDADIHYNAAISDYQQEIKNLR